MIDRSAEAKARKLDLAHAGKIRCARCRYHRNENASRKPKHGAQQKRRPWRD